MFNLEHILIKFEHGVNVIIHLDLFEIQIYFILFFYNFLIEMGLKLTFIIKLIQRLRGQQACS